MAKKKYYFIIHKPYKVLSQFSDENQNKGLGSLFKLPKDVYPVGRLDLDSEGLLILTNDKSLTSRLLDPNQNHERIYWVEVDGRPTDASIQRLIDGVTIRVNGKTHLTKRAKVKIIQPKMMERDPPVNATKHPVRTWIEMRLIEGKNRQVRRMTAAVNHPTLRLIRVAIEDLKLAPLKSGEIRQISENVIYKKLRLT